MTHRRNIIAVKGNGVLTNVGRRKPRCESSRGGKQCCYVAGHEGYHCDQNGLQTWNDPAEDRSTLGATLAKLEASDPEVRRAAQKYDETVRELLTEPKP